MTGRSRTILVTGIIALAGMITGWLVFTESGMDFIVNKPWIRNGERRGYYPDGKLKFSQSRRNGKSDGLYTRWYQDGTKEQEIMFSNGLRSGKCEGWHGNGARAHSGQFANGRYDGTWTFFDTNGVQIAEVTCQNGTFWNGTDARYVNGLLMLTTYENGKVVSSEKRSQ